MQTSTNVFDVTSGVERTMKSGSEIRVNALARGEPVKRNKIEGITNAMAQIKATEVVDSDEDDFKLEDLVEVIEEEVCDNEPGVDNMPFDKKSRIEDALKKFSGSMDELQRFALFDYSKNYVRNLIATDHETYALILLCWSPGKYSPIHDHPCDGCWVKAIKGAVNEVRYQADKETGKLVEVQDETFDSGVTYMHDSMGYHKVGNPHPEEGAITLHLYSPPVEKCSFWLNTDDVSESKQGVCTYYSEYGVKNTFNA